MNDGCPSNGFYLIKCNNIIQENFLQRTEEEEEEEEKPTNQSQIEFHSTFCEAEAEASTLHIDLTLIARA